MRHSEAPESAKYHGGYDPADPPHDEEQADKWYDKWSKVVVERDRYKDQLAAANRKYKPQVLQDSEARVEELEQQLAERGKVVEWLVEALGHLMQSNHGFKPEACSACCAAKDSVALNSRESDSG